MSFSSQAMVIYGEDDRENLTEVPLLLAHKFAQSTLAMFQQDQLSPVGFNLFYLVKSVPMTSMPFKLCPGEKFAIEHSGAGCSGFLVAPDIAVTAGHCLEAKGSCERTRWAFDYREDYFVKSSRQVLRAQDVYGCQKILAYGYSYKDMNFVDYAVFKLDRPVKGRRPLEVQKLGNIHKGEAIFVLGHPSGLPLKFADAAQVLLNDERDHSFTANLDTFTVNSGSAVINAKTGLVEGILVRGDIDYIWDTEKECNRVNRLKKNPQTGGEGVHKITALPEKVLRLIH